MASETKVTVYAALIGNILVALTKFAAAFLTGSSAMLSEAVHSTVDTGNEGLLLYGMHRSRRHPDPEHPLGYGREIYFWSFIVALLLFSLGSGVSFYEGVAHLRSPDPIENVTVSYIVLGLSLLFEGGTWIIALRNFQNVKGERGYLEAIRRSKNPPEFMVLLEDSAAIVGILLAFAGTWAASTFHNPWFDGVASLGIGVLLGAVSILLARESKALLIGEQANPEMQKSLFAIAAETKGVVHANGLVTVQMAPDQVVAALSLQFQDDLTTIQIEGSIAEMEERLREEHPELFLLFVKPQTAAEFEEARDRLVHASSNPA